MKAHTHTQYTCSTNIVQNKLLKLMNLIESSVFGYAVKALVVLVQGAFYLMFYILRCLSFPPFIPVPVPRYRYYSCIFELRPRRASKPAVSLSLDSNVHLVVRTAVPWYPGTAAKLASVGQVVVRVAGPKAMLPRPPTLVLRA